MARSAAAEGQPPSVAEAVEPAADVAQLTIGKLYSDSPKRRQ